VPRTTDILLIAEAEWLLGGRTRDIRLSPGLMRAFRDRSFKQTSKIVRSWMIWVVVLDIMAMGTNLLLLPNEAAIAMLVPAAVIPPSALLVHQIWRRRRPDWLLDYGLLAGLITILIAVGMMGMSAGGEFQERYLSVMLFVAVSAIIIFNVPMKIPVVVAVAGMAVYLVFQLVNPALTVSSTISAFLFFASGIAAMVVARRTITILAHRTFLLELRDAGRAQELITINARLETLSKTDALTGLPNRRYMDETLASLAAAPGARDTAMAVLLCDIDYFKRLNDHLGHAEGDRCLVSVGRVIAETLRPNQDHLARIGGEEFMVVLLGVTPAQALAVAEQLRQRVAALRLPNPKSPLGGIATISIGVAVKGQGVVRTMQELTIEADEALYAAKAKGRNGVALSPKARPSRRAVA
jgi:diguanylate cyclase (GGDEF)-like protein